MSGGWPSAGESWGARLRCKRRWKIWPINEAESVGGGFLLFDDEASMQAFLEGPIVAQVTSHPALSDFSVKQSDIMEDQSRVTRAPI